MDDALRLASALSEDTLDAFGLHGMGGIWGAVLTGIFALEEGLIYSGSFLLIGKQIAGGNGWIPGQVPNVWARGQVRERCGGYDVPNLGRTVFTKMN